VRVCAALKLSRNIVQLLLQSLNGGVGHAQPDYYDTVYRAVRIRSLRATRILSSTSIASFSSRARVRTLSGSSSCSTSQTIACQVLGGSLVRILNVIARLKKKKKGRS
jgi:hypothetical protein